MVTRVQGKVRIPKTAPRNKMVIAEGDPCHRTGRPRGTMEGGLETIPTGKPHEFSSLTP